MKYLVLCMLLMGCTDPCIVQERKNFKYKDKVMITNGFYGGNEGIIIQKRRYRYNNRHGRSCSYPSFMVEVKAERVNLKQSILKLIK